GKKATVKVQVVDPYKPTGVSLSQSGTIQLNRGDKLSLTAVLSPAGAQSTLTWSSSSKAKVSVSNGGVITGLAEGTATITVKTSNGKKATVKVQVVDPTKPTGISLSQSGTVNVYKGETVQLNAALAPASAKSELSWTSSNKKTATVNSNGVVTGVKEGTVTITVKTYNGKKATVKVKVTAAPKQEVSEGSASGSQDASTGTDAVQSPDEGSSSDSVVSHSSLADQVFQQVNTYRAQNGMGALKRSSALDKAAAIRAREIAEVFSHTRPDGSVWYSVSDLAYGENIARNYQTASGVMNGWINSAGHRANILDSYNTIGIAAVQVNGVMCWVQLFGY
ncbi:MAG: Ig-like domain-containing protein, partial [Clostridia bacterium]|nr:Ig-like domain-containing protein [Clostridia bacterium]